LSFPPRVGWTLAETVPQPVAHSRREKVAQISREFTVAGLGLRRGSSRSSIECRSGAPIPALRVVRGPAIRLAHRWPYRKWSIPEPNSCGTRNDYLPSGRTAPQNNDGLTGPCDVLCGSGRRHCVTFHLAGPAEPANRACSTALEERSRLCEVPSDEIGCEMCVTARTDAPSGAPEWLYEKSGFERYQSPIAPGYARRPAGSRALH